MHSADFPSIGTAHRSACLRLFLGLLRSRNAPPSIADQSTRTDRATSIGEVWTDANDGCAFSDDRRTRVDVCALYPTRKGPTITTGADEVGITTAIPAQDHRERRVGKWLQTFANPSLNSRYL